jgi:PAB-dependent poly(A)-specific ribonuclease subunit 2
MKADGSRETIRPARQGLARVSVLRGAGNAEGVPFMDDYIRIAEPVVDYLTAYSGIKPGDLHPETSPHVLVSLKAAYKKLWLLLNMGCLFIGHGLPKDFRIINIHVPRAQVVDTVELFYMKDRGRKLSLRFLAWHILKEEIQTETHDSIEDARTALKLWRKALEFEDAGVLDQIVKETYRKGAEVGFKVPSQLRKDQELPKENALIRPDTSGGDGMSTALFGIQTPERGSTPSGFTAGFRAGTPRKGFGSGRTTFGSSNG